MGQGNDEKINPIIAEEAKKQKEKDAKAKHNAEVSKASNVSKNEIQEIVAAAVQAALITAKQIEKEDALKIKIKEAERLEKLNRKISEIPQEEIDVLLKKHTSQLDNYERELVSAWKKESFINKRRNGNVKFDDDRGQIIAMQHKGIEKRLIQAKMLELNLMYIDFGEVYRSTFGDKGVVIKTDTGTVTLQPSKQLQLIRPIHATKLKDLTELTSRKATRLSGVDSGHLNSLQNSINNWKNALDAEKNIK